MAKLAERVTGVRAPLKRTPLYPAQREAGARMTAFAGWEMPLLYSSILEEHQAVRSAAGLFDVSHMGRIEVRGRGAGAFLERMATRSLLGLGVGRGRLVLLCGQDGGILDDLIVYRRGAEDYLLVVNAANTASDLAWLSSWAPGGGEVLLRDLSPSTAMLALQGPDSALCLSRLASAPPGLDHLPRFGCSQGEIKGLSVFIARTGYTGEDGFEMIVAAEEALSLWALFLKAGARPCGLGARDSLRLEAGFLLYGRDMDSATNPFEAGLERLVELDRGDFVGEKALLGVRRAGIKRRLVGFVMSEQGIPRSDYIILQGDREIGKVTSGGYAPGLRAGIGLGYLPLEFSAPGTEIRVMVRGRALKARIVPLPFTARRRGGA